MASLPATDGTSAADDWIAAYRARAPAGDLLVEGGGDWRAMLAEVAEAASGDLCAASERTQAHAREIGAGFRLASEAEERRWPLSPLPLLLTEHEWTGIAAAIEQRAQLMEMLVADIYGPQRLVTGGHLPAALVTGSPWFLRPMLGLKPPGGVHLMLYAADLARGPDGAWRVLADHTRTPAGAGYALENRLATSRALGGLQARLNVERLAPFFAAFRAGLAAVCRRPEPSIALLTPGRLSQSYAEQAHLARYLGLLLVEGDDLAVHEDQLYVRTIEGLKRIDALWRRVGPRMLDPLAFDSHSRIGVPGLIDAMAAGNAVVANAPGAGVVEAPAFAAFLPKLALRLMGEELAMPNIATWWCGQEAERAEVEARLDALVIAPAFGVAPQGLPEGRPVLGGALAGDARAALLADLARRPMDYVGQEVVRVSTAPVAAADGLEPRPFVLRVFAGRGPSGRWTVMPGGFARIGGRLDDRAALIGEGALTADVCVCAAAPTLQLSLLGGRAAIRRNPGTLPSRVADNLYWLARYLERGEGVLAMVRAALGGAIDVDGGPALDQATTDRLAGLLIGSGAAAKRAAAGERSIGALAQAALDDRHEEQSVAQLLALARDLGDGSRERLSADFWRLLDAGAPAGGATAERAAALQQRFAAFAGLAAEHMGRSEGWRFHDLGRRIERGVGLCRLLRAFAGPEASPDDLTLLLDLAGSQISYRQRYLTALAAAPVRDLVALDATNLRSIAYQVEAIGRHLAELPSLRDDGLAEEQVAQATALSALVATASAEGFAGEAVQEVENRLLALSDAIARRFFLRGGEMIKAAGLTLA